jgi:sarcosine oxidase subunit alpha
MSALRLPSGGEVDRARPLRFRFDGRDLRGFAGDTLASALLANGVRVMGRSFKYHRPRGLLAAGVEEPNALVQVGEGALSTPNLRATEVELYDGLVARAVNCWPSARLDVGALLRPLERFIPAGFYYKSLMWPDWHWFEGAIRRAAGLGRVAGVPDPSRYESRYAHCDVLVVGAGPAGLEAAVEAAARGERVLLCEQEPRIGGCLLWERREVTGPVLDGEAARDWIAARLAQLQACPDVQVATRTTALGHFDHGALTLVERVAEHLGPQAPAQLPRQRLWQVRAGRVVLATGALERPLVFPGNDRPGVMLATGVRRYLGEFAVRAGERVVIFTNNDAAYATAAVLRASGGAVVAIVDTRTTPGDASLALAAAADARVLRGAAIVATHGDPALRAVTVRDATGRRERLEADLLAMSGGFSPTAHLFSQAGGTLQWDAASLQFRPAGGAASVTAVGDAAGVETPIEPCWRVEAPGKAFVDFQNDVTVDDVELAAREGFVSIEHLKRYTTLGMAPDQGKTANVNGLALLGSMTGREPGQVGATRHRFPYTPVALGAIAGRRRGELFHPVRRLPLHDWHAAHGAAFDEYGGWMRPAQYPRPGESRVAAEQREALAVRDGVGLFDASPLGKIEVVGPDAAAFLDRIYANAMSTVQVGRLRYGLMLSELGVVIDDGVAARLADDRFLVGTTSGGAARIAAMLEEWLQCEWTGLRVLVAPVTTRTAVLTLTGPAARRVLETVGADFPLAADAFPHMTFREGAVGGVPARVFRVSFTGELSYEINVPNSAAAGLWQQLMDAGAAHGITPVGIEAWMLLRTEKGYLHVGADTDGTTAPDDIGWGHVLRRDVDFVGRRSLTRPENRRADRHQLVGLEPLDGAALPVGSHLRSTAAQRGSEGYVTSSGFSPTLQRWVALAMLRAGRARHGETVTVLHGAQPLRARVTAPGSYDPQGERLRG